MDALEQAIVAAVDRHAQQLLDFSRAVAAHAEAGFFEFETAKRTAQMLRAAGLSPAEGLARTGVKAVLAGGADGPCAAVIGELDGIRCPAHPQAVPGTGMAHACGHNAQLAAMAGAAFALSQPEVAQALCGSVAFFAVPAEEYVPIPTRRQLASEGVRFCCGKSELLRTGAFDDVDLALTTHVHMIPCERDFLLGNVASSGFVSKTVTFKGRAAHAAAAPWDGANALNAAALALSAVGLLRETFRDDDCVRIHTNVTRGGDALNVVPGTAVLEAMVRAKNLAAIEDAAAKFDRACRHAALALGCEAEIDTQQGYMPVRFAPACRAQQLAAAALGKNAACEEARPELYNNASTDVGDLSHVLPVVNFTHAGAAGALHSADFRLADEEKAVLAPAKMLALTVYHLLRGGAALAREVTEGFSPVYSAAQYVRHIEEGVR